jgi:hypothetical protein
MKAVLLAAHAVLAASVLTACSDANVAQPASLETAALISSAPAWQPSDITADLQLDERTRAQVDATLGAMHAAMLDLHARHEAALALDGHARTAALDALDADIRALHEQHHALWDALEPEVAAALATRIHEKMGEHGGSAMQSLHERMRRLLGGSHDAHAAGH